MQLEACGCLLDLLRYWGFFLSGRWDELRTGSVFLVGTWCYFVFSGEEWSFGSKIYLFISIVCSQSTSNVLLLLGSKIPQAASTKTVLLYTVTASLLGSESTIPMNWTVIQYRRLVSLSEHCRLWHKTAQWSPCSTRASAVRLCQVPAAASQVAYFSQRGASYGRVVVRARQDSSWDRPGEGGR